jgi:Flp pilus assembly pilin Flp
VKPNRRGEGRSLFADDGGQGLAEYGLILAFIATICVAVVALIGANLARTLTHVGTGL